MTTTKLTQAICLLILTLSCSTQKQPKVDLTWNIVEHQEEGHQTISELELHNPSKDVKFPGGGWTIYFNAGDPKTLNDNDTSLLKITHINGDYFKITPGKSFEGIESGQVFRLKIISRRMKNVTDYGNGFYLMYDEAPSEPVELDLKTKSNIDYSQEEKRMAQAHFDQNKSILQVSDETLPPIFPTPLQYELKEGTFEINGETKIIADTDFEKEAKVLIDALGQVLSATLATQDQQQENSIVLVKNNNPSTEGYEIDITPQHITISAATSAGIFYGIQSLKTMLPAQTWKAKEKSIKLPALHIKDEPRFAHRAFMMDISRNFLPKSQVLKVLDALALYKINVMHLHFNDDEGWRIEIKDLPELTAIGGQRGHTLTEEDRLYPAYGSGPSTDNTSGSGFLTRADFIEILRYANERHIKIIPEYETPGHARSAIKSMDARYAKYTKEGKKEEAEKYLLRDLEDQSVYRSVQGFNDNILNPALPSVYTFIEKIIDETIDMYNEANAPLHTIHFGGDEVPEGVWEKSPAIQSLLAKDKSIGSVDEIWHYYFKNVNALLKERGLYLSGWEEIGLKKQLVGDHKKMVLDTRFSNENFHTDVWNNLSGNEDLAYLLANAGYKVVLTNVTNMYLDLAYDKSYDEIGQYWGGYVDVDKPFSFIPYDYYKNQKEDHTGTPLAKNHYDGKIRLHESSKQNIVGLQAPLWSEKIISQEIFEYLFLPKILGLAERAWAPNPVWAKEYDDGKSQSLYQQDWSAFVQILGKRELPRLDHYAGGFAYRIPTPGYQVVDNTVEANVLYPDLTIHYTEDGSEPTANSKQYTSPIPYSDSLKLKVFNKEGRSGRSVKVVK